MKNYEEFKKAQLGLLSVTSMMVILAPVIGNSLIKRFSFFVLLVLGLLLAAKILKYQLKRK